MRRPLLNLFGVLLCTALCVFQAKAQDVNLELLGTYKSGVFDEGAAEIGAFDPDTDRLFVTNADANSVDILDISDPTNPTKIGTINVEAIVPNGGVNSVAVAEGLVAIAVELGTDPGSVAFLQANVTIPVDSIVAAADQVVEVGSLPDMIIFTPNGEKVLVANEGEPSDDGMVDPEGSVSIIDVNSFTATTADFNAFDSQRASLLARGVRIFNFASSVSADLEPEFIAVNPDNATAAIVCQENNALAILDIANAQIVEILPLGVKDHSSGQPSLSLFDFNEPPLDSAQNILFGGLSGLWFEKKAGDDYIFLAVPDRGPNGNGVDVRPVGSDTTFFRRVREFLIPDFQATVIRFAATEGNSEVKVIDETPLYRVDEGDTIPITGISNIPGFDEAPVQPVTNKDSADFEDENGNFYKALPYDAFGGDMEGIVTDPNGNFWTVDEYRPAIYQFSPEGELLNRFVPEGTSKLGTIPQDFGFYGSETLPEEYSNRRTNRGFEGMALDTKEGILYAFIQTPLENPDRATSNASKVIRMLGIDPATGTPVAEYVYLLDRPITSNVDKIGDAVYDPTTGRFYLIVRDSGFTPTSNKPIFEIDLTGATNLLDPMAPSLKPGLTLEQHTPEDLADQGIQPVFKRKVLNLPSIGYLPSDKPEGLALLEDGRLAVLNDNDFGLEPGREAVQLGIISFDEALSNAIDASNEDGVINIQNWPTLGMYQPDAIVSYQTGGAQYYISANEGDARDYDFFSEEERVKGLMLDATEFPDAATLQQDENLGRLNSTTENGDIDGDGDFERIYSYGARSFTIWDAVGNIVWDSGNELEELTAALLPDDFNSTNDENQSFDNRSDDKGPEPEGVTVGMLGGIPYAFVGLERVGGVAVYDVSDPTAPTLVDYVNNRDFSVVFDLDEEGDPDPTEAQLDSVGDLGPEGILFISAEDSPNGEPLLVVTNEVSGTTTIFGVNADTVAAPFTLAIFHNNDAESKLLFDEDEMCCGISRFTTKVREFRMKAMMDGQYPLMLSSGDNFIPSPEFEASLQLPDSLPYYDAIGVNNIMYDAMAIGNHEFDLGPDVLEKFVSDTEAPLAWLSANLDFSMEPGLQNLVDSGRIAPKTVVERGGEKIGIIGLTTPNLPFVSSPRDVIVDDDLVGVLQGQIDMLQADSVNKIILISHLQGIDEELDLITQVTGVDIVIAGGGDDLLANDNSELLPGDTPEGDYPTVGQDANGNDVYFVTTAGNFRYLGRLVAEFDDEGNVTAIGDDSGTFGIFGAIDQAQDQEEQVVEPVAAFVASLDSIIVAQSEVPLDGIRNNIRFKETNEGNLIGDAMKWQGEQLGPDFGVDNGLNYVGIQNGGGIRNNNIIPAGPISLNNTFQMLPFGNIVVVIPELTPQRLLDVMNNALSRVLLGTGASGTGRFAQVGGMSVEYFGDTTEFDVPSDMLVANITLDDGTKIVENAEVVDGAPNVNLAIADFLAKGGDQYPLDDLEFIALGVTYQQALANYLTVGLDSLIAEADYPVVEEGAEERIIPLIVTGLNDLVASTLVLFPVPVEQRLNISNEEMNINTIRVFNTAGQLMLNVVPQRSTGAIELDLTSLQAGVYVIELIDDAKDIRLSRRIIKN